AGIVGVDGDFDAGDVVDLVDPAQRVVARGVVAYDVGELPDMIGRSTHELPDDHRREVVHADDLVPLGRGWAGAVIDVRAAAGIGVGASRQRSSVPRVSGRRRITRNAIAAPTATYQKNATDASASDRAVITSGAVPPKTATVRLYQAPIPSARTDVGNSSLMIAGAIDVIAV